MRETVAVLKAADMAPLDVTGYGTLAERRPRGRGLRGRAGADARAGAENAVVVAEVTPIFDGRGLCSRW